MLSILKRFFGLVVERRLGQFLREKSVFREVIRHGFSSGTVYFLLFRSLPRYFRDKLGKRGVVTVGEVRHLRRKPPGKSPLSPVDLNRLCDAYALMKSESPSDLTSPYFVGGLWEEWASDHQSHLIRALRARDFAALSSIFSRIGADEASKGISLSGDQPGGFFGSIDLVNRLNAYLATYSNLYPNGSIARYPADWGSFPGALRGGVLLPSAPRLSHNARTLQGLLTIDGGHRGHLVEIGGGFGGVPFHLARELRFGGTYTNFDIPEVLIIAAAFLIAVMPEDSVYLYGDAETLQSARIRLFPHYKFPEVQAGSVDVVFNSHSLSEMNFETVSEYLAQIERIRPLFFLHMNHEYGSLYKAPSGGFKAHAVIGPSGLDLSVESYKRIYRSPEILINDGLEYGATDYWENLYMRVGG